MSARAAVHRPLSGPGGGGYISLSALRQTAILYVAPRFPARSETFVYREWLGLAARGHTMHAVTLRKAVPLGDPQLDALNPTVAYESATLRHLLAGLLARPGLTLRALREALDPRIESLADRLKYLIQGGAGIALGHRLARQGIGHVHAHFAHAPATVALFIARYLEVHFSFTGHAADLFRDRSALALKLEAADSILCISHWHRDFYRGIGADEAKLHIVRCAVDIPDTATSRDPGPILCVARLVPKKGVDLLLEAFAHLPGDPRLTIIGDGPQRAALQAQAAALGIADRVDFLGACGHGDVLAAMDACRLFVLPSRIASDGDRDGIPVVLMEAMARARPVIAGDLEAIRELVPPGTGLLVPPDDVPALTAALGSLLGDPEKARAMSLAGREHVTREFATAINLDRFEEATIGAR